MAYVNPFDLLEVGAPGQLDTAQLKREKKRLMAEFELSGEVEIAVGEHRLDKATLLKLFEELEDPEQRSYHAEVAARPMLQKFLTEASLDLFYEAKVGELAGLHPDFLRWLGSHFAVSFNRRLVHALRQQDLEETQVLCREPLPIPTAYQAACFQDSYRYLHQQVEEVENLAKGIEKGKKPSGRVQEVCDEMFIDLLNALPAYFDGVRDRYGLALENLALVVQNQHQRTQLSLFIVRQGLKIQLSEDTHRRLKYVLEQLLKLAPVEEFMETLTGTGEEAKRKRQGLWWWAVGVGAAIVLLAKWLL